MWVEQFIYIVTQSCYWFFFFFFFFEEGGKILIIYFSPFVMPRIFYFYFSIKIEKKKLFSENFQIILNNSLSQFSTRELNCTWNLIQQQLLAAFFHSLALFKLPFGIRNCNKSGNKQAKLRRRQEKIEMNSNWNEANRVCVHAWPIEWASDLRARQFAT